MILKDLRILDLSRLVSGNITTHVLADLGADVIKVESPDTGDSLRNWTCQGLETWWKIYGRGKRSLALDLRAPDALHILKAIIKTADVLVENFRPGTLEAMGLGPDEIWKINPKVVVLRISGWGQSGPFKHKPGFGSLVEAYSGFAAMNGFADREPVLPPFAMADCFAGVFGACAILAACREAERTGHGDVIDVSLLEPLFSLLGPLTLEAKLKGHGIPRQGSGSPTHAPRNIYETRDGKFVALSAAMEPMVRRLLKAIGKPDLIKDPRFATHAARITYREDLDREIGDFIKLHTRAACLDLFEAADVTVGPVMDATDLLTDSFMRERGALIDQPDQELGTIPAPAPPIRFQRARGRTPTSAPRIGEHSDEILNSIGRCKS